jgi:hypothetical protein
MILGKGSRKSSGATEKTELAEQTLDSTTPGGSKWRSTNEIRIRVGG